VRVNDFECYFLIYNFTISCLLKLMDTYNQILTKIFNKMKNYMIREKIYIVSKVKLFSNVLKNMLYKYLTKFNLHTR